MSRAEEVALLGGPKDGAIEYALAIASSMVFSNPRHGIAHVYISRRDEEGQQARTKDGRRVFHHSEIIRYPNRAEEPSDS